MKNHILPPILKALIVWVCFFLLGFLYGSQPGDITGMEIFIRRGIAIFLAAIVAGAVEFLIDRKRITDGQSYLFARMLSAVVIPYIFVMIWIFIPSISGQIILSWLNSFYLFLAAFGAAFFASLLERSLEEIKLQNGLIVLTGFLFILTLVLTALFSIRQPLPEFLTGSPL
ncbi:MAG: hypothetical protein A2014_00885 [Spirochaetes bacterium GWF1_49_6]|nr:MAG: hypothetical protein A2014_00885 [Spirochaetes bacterium GWF1_49_6]